MPAAAQISVEEYLHTAYRPDCDYLDGELEERNVGERDHGRVQGALYAWLFARENELNIQVFLEQRLQISSTRFRVPDLCVVLGHERTSQILDKPPFVCVEVLSREDRLPRMMSRINDYLDFGVKYVWVIDPETRWGGVYTKSGFEAVEDGLLRTSGPEIVVDLREIFQAL